MQIVGFNNKHIILHGMYSNKTVPTEFYYVCISHKTNDNSVFIATYLPKTNALTSAKSINVNLLTQGRLPKTTVFACVILH